MVEHGEEVVHHRRVPAGEELAFQGAVGGGEFVGALLGEGRGGLGQGRAEPGAEGADGAGQTAPGAQQTEHGGAEVTEVGEPRAEAGGGDARQQLGRHLLLHAHHLLHEAAVPGEAGQQRDGAIPVHQAVVDATLHEAEHAAEEVGVFLQLFLRHAEQAAELPIHLLVDVSGE